MLGPRTRSGPAIRFGPGTRMGSRIGFGREKVSLPVDKYAYIYIYICIYILRMHPYVLICLDHASVYTHRPPYASIVHPN